MDLASGILKLERLIKSRKSLEEKLKGDSGNVVIQGIIKKHQDDIDYIKNNLNFDARFEVNSPAKECKCEDKCGLPKVGDTYEDGVVEGLYVKVKPINKDGSVSKVSRYVELKGE